MLGELESGRKGESSHALVKERWLSDLPSVPYPFPDPFLPLALCPLAVSAAFVAPCVQAGR
jgi:hypothetical protein